MIPPEIKQGKEYTSETDGKYQVNQSIIDRMSDIYVSVTPLLISIYLSITSVYCFGVILYELLTGKPRESFIPSAFKQRQNVNQPSLHLLSIPNLSQYQECYQPLIDIFYQCLSESLYLRPTSQELFRQFRVMEKDRGKRLDQQVVEMPKVQKKEKESKRICC